jgi:hypothetical protein
LTPGLCARELAFAIGFHHLAPDEEEEEEEEEAEAVEFERARRRS